MGTAEESSKENRFVFELVHDSNWHGERDIHTISCHASKAGAARAMRVEFDKDNGALRTTYDMAHEHDPSIKGKPLKNYAVPGFFKCEVNAVGESIYLHSENFDEDCEEELSINTMEILA